MGIATYPRLLPKGSPSIALNKFFFNKLSQLFPPPKSLSTSFFHSRFLSPERQYTSPSIFTSFSLLDLSSQFSLYPLSGYQLCLIIPGCLSGQTQVNPPIPYQMLRNPPPKKPPLLFFPVSNTCPPPPPPSNPQNSIYQKSLHPPPPTTHRYRKHKNLPHPFSYPPFTTHP